MSKSRLFRHTYLVYAVLSVEGFLCFTNSFSSTETEKENYPPFYPPFLPFVRNGIFSLPWATSMTKGSSDGSAWHFSFRGSGRWRLKARRIYTSQVFFQRVKPECKHLLTIQIANIKHSDLRYVYMSVHKFSLIPIHRLVTGNLFWTKVGKQHCPVLLHHFTWDYLYNQTEWKQKPLSSVSEWSHEGSQEALFLNLFQELECPCPHWKNQKLVSSGTEEIRWFLRCSA